MSNMKANNNNYIFLISDKTQICVITMICRNCDCYQFFNEYIPYTVGSIVLSLRCTGHRCSMLIHCFEYIVDCNSS